MQTEKKIKVLLADDSSSFLHFEKVLLTSTDYDIITAGNGLEALKLAKEEMPDVMFLDVNMPEMTGLELCRMVKSDPSLRHIAVIMVTTMGKDEDIEAGYQVGCNDYLFKPVKKSVLIEKIQKFTLNLTL